MGQAMRGGYRHHATCKGARPRLIPGKGAPLAAPGQLNAKKFLHLFQHYFSCALTICRVISRTFLILICDLIHKSLFLRTFTSLTKGDLIAKKTLWSTQ